MLSNIPKTETDKLKTPNGRREHLIECRQRALDVITSVSDAVADDRVNFEELANEVVALAQTMHGLVVLVEAHEAEREAARQTEAEASVEIQANLQRCRELLSGGKPEAEVSKTPALDAQKREAASRRTVTVATVADDE